MWNGLWNEVRGFHTLWWRWFRIQKFVQQAMYDTTEGTRLGYTCFLQQLLDLYSHTLSLQDIRLFKIVTTQVWISTFLLEHTTYKDHTWKDNHTPTYTDNFAHECTICFKTTVRRLVRRLHASTHDEQDSVDCKCLFESVGSRGQSLGHMTKCTAHCNGSGM